MIFKFGSNGKLRVIWVGSDFLDTAILNLCALFEVLSANGNYTALWDNRCVLHAATNDHEGLGPRVGWRTVSIAETPFLDPSSISRRQTKLKEAATTNGIHKIDNETTTKDSDAVKDANLN